MADEFELGLHHSALVPFSLEWMDEAPSTERLSQADSENEFLLKALLAMDERSLDLNDDESGLAQEIHRLDQKLNLLLGLVADLLRKEDPAGEPTSVRLAGEAIQWRDDRACESGRSGRLCLYLNPNYPKPLRLYIRCHGHFADPEGNWNHASYIGMAAAVQEHLEKFIFRQHRRSIAVARGAG